MTLGSKAIAYLNVDCAVQGPGFFARATPQLDELLIEITKKVKDPDNKEATVYEMWTKANDGIDEFLLLICTMEKIFLSTTLPMTRMIGW